MSNTKRRPTTCKCPLCQRRRIKQSLTFRDQRELLRFADSMATELGMVIKLADTYWNAPWYKRLFLHRGIANIIHQDTIDNAGELGYDYERWSDARCGERKPVLVDRSIWFHPPAAPATALCLDALASTEASLSPGAAGGEA